MNEELTPTQLRLLAALTEPMTSTELFAEVNLSYPHGITILRKLKQQGYIDELPKQQDGKIFYFTKRTALTEPLYIAKEKGPQQTKSKLVKFLWEGKLQSFAEVLASLSIKKKEQPDLLHYIIQTLRVLVYNSSIDQTKFVPTAPFAQDLKNSLIKRIQQEEKYIKLAKIMLESPIWDEDTPVWRKIVSQVGSDEDNNLRRAMHEMHELWRENKL